jgi:hypothetical protein
MFPHTFFLLSSHHLVVKFGLTTFGLRNKNANERENAHDITSEGGKSRFSRMVLEK